MIINESVKNNISRGFKLLFLGYLLNLLRAIPFFIASLNGHYYPAPRTPLDLLLTIDILQLAGLSIIFCTIFKKSIINNKYLTPVIILLFLFIFPVFPKIFGENFISAAFWGTAENIRFPFFPYFIYPLLGMYLSKYLLNSDNKIKKYLLNMTWIGVFIIFLGFSSIDFLRLYKYWDLKINNHIIILGFIFIWIPLCYLMAYKFKEQNKIIKTLLFWSKNVTTIYFIQWILFSWSILIFGLNSQTAVVSAILGLVVLVITHGLIKLNNYFRGF